jgi:hypothetical protein
VTWDLWLDGSAGAALRLAAPGEYRVSLTAGSGTADTTLRLDRFVRWTR